jgi:hypothetical protein
MEYALIVVVIVIVILLIGREISCWYFKINKRIELQLQTNELLEKLIKQSKVQTQPTLSSVIFKNGNILIDGLEIAPIDLPEKMNWEDANNACRELGEGWKLPSKDELNKIFQNKDRINGLDSMIYWSSSEHIKNSAWLQYFNSGNQLSSNKNDKFSVRPLKVS